jgi:hypothetical protein
VYRTDDITLWPAEGRADKFEGETMLIERRLTPNSPIGAWAKVGLLMFATCLIFGPVLRAADASTPPARQDPKAKPAGSAKIQKERSPQARKAVGAPRTPTQAARKPLAPASSSPRNDVALLKERLAHQEELLAAQQKQISKLVDAIEEQKQLLQQSLRSSGASETPANSPQPQGSPLPSLGQVASLRPAIPLVSPAAAPVATALPAVLPAGSPAAQNAQAQEQIPPYAQRVDLLGKEVENLSKGIAGFHFSGDFRLRGDGIVRSEDADGAAEQNIRGRLRARFNIDRGIGDQLAVHLQLGSGNFDNPLTDDTDFGGSATPGPLFLREAWVNYHPNSTLNLQGGRMYDVFQDGSRFMWDEDVRFDGTQESVGASPGDNPLGITRIDFRAGQYVLTNPNLQVLPSLKQCTQVPQTITTLPATITTPATLPAACAYLSAGYSPGQNVRAADMFDQGFFIKGRINPGWSQYVYSDFIAYRNPDQIALASTSAGLPVLVNTIPGVTLAATLPGTGNATTLPGGGIYSASHFQIAHVAYRLTYDGAKVRGESFPVFLDVQGSRNVGTSFLRNAWIAMINAGDIQRAGDVRFQYAYAEKDANSMVSQYTDDQLGTNSGVNIRTHVIRFDLGLTRYLQWQNILYIQNPISGNDPAKHFYVPVPLGVNTQYRATSSLLVSF